MAGSGADLVLFLKEMAEREERRRIEEEKNRETEREARRMEMIEMFKQMTELVKLRNERQEEDRERLERERQEERREGERRRQQTEEERRAEDRLYRKAQEEIKDKLAGFSGFREGGDLTLYLEKFEHVMKDCEIAKASWAMLRTVFTYLFRLDRLIQLISF